MGKIYIVESGGKVFQTGSLNKIEKKQAKNLGAVYGRNISTSIPNLPN